MRSKNSISLLLIDDMQALTIILEKGLKSYGYVVYTAFDGKKGIEIFKREKIDLILCDLGMEGMNGAAVSQYITDYCREHNLAKIPFVLITGWALESELEDDLFEAGVDSILVKPVEFAKLLAIIEEHINQGEQGT
jgi:CheY-like chemotaxis protein